MVIVMAGCRLRGRGFDSRIGIFFFHSLFFCLIFSPFFFLHARSAILMLKHFSSFNFSGYTVEPTKQQLHCTCTLSLNVIELHAE